MDRISEIIGINNALIVKTTLDNADISFGKGSNSDEIVIVLHSVIDNDLKTSLVQVKTIFSYLPFFNKFQT